ncbi:hypothetical protein QFC21_005378 [Naganishia friedmannii]|uniref:Uncharacterized protein n=1 Tax=Naganishia friedmannii TaxID=89922 RepID=A0ACC2VAJ7_9TREE|nr:hypothetical protein QFC21_005378 [Naganishia friedmannii]
MSERTIQLLQSLGYSAPQSSTISSSSSSSSSSSNRNIIDLRPASTQQNNTANTDLTAAADEDDTLDFLSTLLSESQDVAVETFGAASFAVGNISDDPDIEDVAVVLGNKGTAGGTGEVWQVLVDKLGLDLSNVCHLSRWTPGTATLEVTTRNLQFADPVITPINLSVTDSAALDQPTAPPPLIKGSKLYNLLAGLKDLRKVTVSARDDSVLLVAWVGERKGTLLGLLGVTETT